MITPAYALTATERVLPRLALDFTTAVLDSRVAVSRALDTATRVNSSGYIEIVNANLPRFDYSPTSVGVCRGLLIEEARSNFFVASNDPSSWPVATIRTTVTANNTTSPDGTVNASKILTNTASPAGTYIGRDTGISTSAGTFCINAYVKKGTSNGWVALYVADGTNSYTAWFDITNGAKGSTNTVGSGFTALNYDIVNAGNGWYRCWITITRATTTQLATYFFLDCQANSTFQSTLNNFDYFYGAQVEAGAFPTSYIPTTTTSLTRNADAVSMTGTNFSDWYNATEGTLFAQVTGITFGAGTAKGVVSVSSGSYLNSINMYYKADGTTNYGEILASGAAEAVFTLTPQTNKVAIAYKANNANMGYGGLVGTTDTSMTVPSGINQMIIGNVYSTSSSNHPNGCIQKIAYYPQRLTNAELQAITK